MAEKVLFSFDWQKSPMDIRQNETNLPAGRQGNFSDVTSEYCVPAVVELRNSLLSGKCEYPASDGDEAPFLRSRNYFPVKRRKPWTLVQGASFDENLFLYFVFGEILIQIKNPELTGFSLFLRSVYFSSTLAPAASSFFFASSAAVLLTPVKISFGAASTKSFASLRPKF